MKESGESLKGHIVCRAGAPEARPGETIGKSVTSVAEKTPEYWGHQNHALSVKGSTGEGGAGLSVQDKLEVTRMAESRRWHLPRSLAPRRS